MIGPLLDRLGLCTYWVWVCQPQSHYLFLGAHTTVQPRCRPCLCSFTLPSRLFAWGLLDDLVAQRHADHSGYWSPLTLHSSISSFSCYWVAGLKAVIGRSLCSTMQRFGVRVTHGRVLACRQEAGCFSPHYVGSCCQVWKTWLHLGAVLDHSDFSFNEYFWELNYSNSC